MVVDDEEDILYLLPPIEESLLTPWLSYNSLDSVIHRPVRYIIIYQYSQSHQSVHMFTVSQMEALNQRSENSKVA